MLLISLFLISCGDDENDMDPGLSVGGMNVGKVSSAVVVVNPVFTENPEPGQKMKGSSSLIWLE